MISALVEAKSFPVVGPPLPKANPCVVVIFGALGDLTSRKLARPVMPSSSSPE